MPVMGAAQRCVVLRGHRDAVVDRKIRTEALSRPEIRAADRIVDDRRPPVETPLLCPGQIDARRIAANDAQDIVDDLTRRDLALIKDFQLG